jgi:hypothetical protein
MAVLSSIQKKGGRPLVHPKKKGGRPLVHPKKRWPSSRPSKKKVAVLSSIQKKVAVLSSIQKKSGRPLVHPKKGGFRYRSTHPTTTHIQPQSGLVNNHFVLHSIGKRYTTYQNKFG